MNLKTYFKSTSQSQAELAKVLGVTPGAVNQWANGLSAVSAERCPAIERATGGLVRCEDLRPDVQWSVLRNTPELAQAPANQAQEATQTVANDGDVITQPSALRTGTTRRHDTRRKQDPLVNTDRRAQGGAAFQSNQTGVA